MTTNLKTELAQNNAAAPPEQKSPWSSGVEFTPESHSETSTVSAAQPRGPPTRMIRFGEVIERTGLSRTTIWRKVRGGEFPAPVQLGVNSVGWPEHEVEDWRNSRPRVHYAPAT